MRKGAKLAALLFPALLLFPLFAISQTASLTILHTNDTHGHLMPFSYPASAPAGSELAGLTVTRHIGGIARRASIFKKLREDLSRNGTPVWLVDAGDFSDGTPFSTEYHGEADVQAMNAAGYDFGTLGNHEFNYQLSRVKSLIGMVRYTLLCANAVENSSGELLAKAYEIRELPPLRIGIFGLVTHEASGYPAAKEGVKILDEIKTAEEMVRTLRPKADIIIAISHSGDEKDEAIARAVPGIDVIVGGHSHSRLPSGDFVWHSDQLKPKEVNGTIIVQAHQWAGELGRLDLLFEKDDQGAWNVSRYRARLIPVATDSPEDPAVASVVDRYWKPLAPRFGEVIGQALADFVTRGDDLAPYNLVTDSIRETFKTEIEFENMGGVRSDLVAGNITRADLVNMDPFDNTVVTFRMKGRQLKDFILKHRPAVSGIEYRIEKGRLVKARVGGKPIQDARIYTGATNSFFARTAMNDVRITDTKKPRLETIINAIRKKKTVNPTYDGRRVVID